MPCQISKCLFCWRRSDLPRSAKILGAPGWGARTQEVPYDEALISPWQRSWCLGSPLRGLARQNVGWSTEGAPRLSRRAGYLRQGLERRIAVPLAVMLRRNPNQADGIQHGVLVSRRPLAPRGLSHFL